jgi:histidinol-phosphate phosphatase family protein
MKAFVLAAGAGARLRPLTDTRPKPMLPVCGLPALDHSLRWLRAHGVVEVTVNLHHHGAAIADYCGDGRAWDLRLSYAYEERLLGSAGALAAARSPEGAGAGEPLAVVYGDVLTDLDLGALLAFHDARRAPGRPHVTLALYRVARPSDCGIVALDGDGRVTRFVEKPAPAGVFSDLASAGVLIVEPALLNTLPPAPCDIGHDWLPRLLACGAPVYGWPIPPATYLVDFGTPEAYARVQREWPRRVAVFLDRDGVINENRPDYVRAWDQLALLPGSLDALRALAATPWRVVVVSNQSGVGRGVIARETVEDIHRRLQATVAAAGGRLDALYVCPHRPDEDCACRKPRPGLLRRAAEELGLSLRRSYFVGDHRTDLQAAWAAGAQALLVRTGLGARCAAELTPGERERCTVCDDLAAAVRWILARERCGGADAA